jgi:PAS domain-containing protein
VIPLIIAACLTEWACYLTITLAICSAGRRRPIQGIAWLCGYAACSGWGRLLTALSFALPLRPVQTAWHVVTAGVGLGATFHLLRLTQQKDAVRRIGNALQGAAAAIDAQQLVDSIPFPSAAMDAEGSITAVNELLTRLLGCSSREIEGLRWTRYLNGRERVRVIANWVDFGQGAIEHFYEESNWRRPVDRHTIQIATRGLLVGSQLVCSVADITFIPAGGDL